MRTSSRITFAVSWLVLAGVAFFAWRKVLGVPDGRGDVTWLFAATFTGALGLATLGAWLSEYESRQR